MEQYSWFKSYDPGMPHTLQPYEPKTLLDCFDEALKAYCKERLRPYKVPRQIEIRPSLPKSAIGKPLARILLDEELAKKQQ